MEVKSEVVAAITAALNLYMQIEQQAAVADVPVKTLEVPRPSFSPWALAGRQAAMEMRRMWQMRLIR